MMMRRIGLWLLLVVAAGGMALNTSLKARQQEEKLAALKVQTDAERDRLRILTAEWASLTSPARLEKLSSKHLNLKPIGGTEMISLSDIPERLVPAPSAKPAVPTQLAEAATEEKVEEVKVAVKEPVKEVASSSEAVGQNKVKKAVKVAKAKPVEKKQLASAAPAPKDDMIRELIEKDQPKGVLWANFEGEQR